LLDRVASPCGEVVSR